MTVAFLDNSTNSIIHLDGDQTQLITQYQRDPNYQKLYEEAHIEVNMNMWFSDASFAVKIDEPK